MAKRGATTTVLIAALIVGTMAWSASGQTQRTPATRSYQYVVPFMCGWLPPVPPDLIQFATPGTYHTSVVVHNPGFEQVPVRVRVMLGGRAGGTPPPPIGAGNEPAKKNRSLTFDCPWIWAQASLPPGTFIHGALHLGTDERVPVTGFYSAQTHDDPNAGPGAAAGTTSSVEQFEPFIGP